MTATAHSETRNGNWTRNPKWANWFSLILIQLHSVGQSVGILN